MNITKKLLIIPFLTLALMLTCCNASEDKDAYTDALGTYADSYDISDGVETEKDFIDSFIFFGESTTYHLKSRGVLSGGTRTHQVWAPSNGTAALDTSTHKIKIVYPESGELLSLSDAVTRKRPKRMLLCFGLNGAVGTVAKGEEYFKTCYRLLIDTVMESSEHTEIFIASAYPVAKNMDMSRYSVALDTLNSYIRRQNEWASSLASEYSQNGKRVRYIDIAKPLLDSDGRLALEYQSGDGHHLTAEAYRQVLKQIIRLGYAEAKK